MTRGSSMLEERAATREEAAIQRAVAALQHALGLLPAEDVEAFAERIEQLSAAGTAREVSDAKARLIKALGGRQYSDEERLHLESLALLENFRRRRELLKDSYTAPEVAELLDTTRQTPYDRAKSGSLLAVLDHGALRFPRWQFDPEGDEGVVPGLPRIARELRLPPLSKIGWFVRPTAFLDGSTPLESLKKGQVERVTELARAAGRT